MDNLHDLEAPLEGLVKKPMDEMTIDELREEIRILQEYRTSSQSLGAQYRKVAKPSTPSVFDDL